MEQAAAAQNNCEELQKVIEYASDFTFINIGHLSTGCKKMITVVCFVKVFIFDLLLFSKKSQGKFHKGYYSSSTLWREIYILSDTIKAHSKTKGPVNG